MSEPSVPPPPPYNPPPPPVGPGTSSGGTVSPNRSLMIVLSYLWLLFLIPLLVEKDDREVQWHARHGLVLTVAEFAVWLVIWVFKTFMPDIVACASCFVSMAIWLAFVVVRILCIVKGVNGQRFIIPGLSQYADRF